MSKPIPTIDRPAIPAEYGVANGTEFSSTGSTSRTASPLTGCTGSRGGNGGRPRIRPIDGLYLDGAIYVGGSPETRIGSRRCGPIGTSASISTGSTTSSSSMAWRRRSCLSRDDLAERLAAASNAKFPEYGMTAAFYKTNGAIAVRLRKVIAWTEFTRDPTRFRFEG